MCLLTYLTALSTASFVSRYLTQYPRAHIGTRLAALPRKAVSPKYLRNLRDETDLNACTIRSYGCACFSTTT